MMLADNDTLRAAELVRKYTQFQAVGGNLVRDIVGLMRAVRQETLGLTDYKWDRPEDQHHARAAKLVEKWVTEINMVGMMSLNRDYLKKLTIEYLESKMVAECLIDLLAAEFRKDAS